MSFASFFCAYPTKFTLILEPIFPDGARQAIRAMRERVFCANERLNLERLIGLM
jgi:hypothetical protein